MRGSKYIRLRLDFIVHLDREVDSIPMSREMLLDLIDDAADSAVKKLGSKGLLPEDRHRSQSAVDAMAPAVLDEIAAKVRASGAVPVEYTDGHVRCDLFFPRKRKTIRGS
jgi:hypothetical protein